MFDTVVILRIRHFSEMTASNLVVPIVVWGRTAPTHCVASILMTSDMKKVVTGCNDGQICVWDILDNWQV